MKQELYAFWSYDKYPYCLWGKIEEFKGDLVYIKSYQGWFRPFKIMEGKSAEDMILKLKTLECNKKHEIEIINKSFKEQLMKVLPAVYKK